MSRATDAKGQAAAGDHPGCQLYLITPPAIELDGFAGILAEALDAGPVACVQLRLKDIDDKALKQAADTLRDVCHARDVAFIVNDRPDIAAAVGADGAHIGEDDVSYEEARKILGPDRIVGVSCYDSRHKAMSAGEAGADYVAFGAIYETTTKVATTRAGLDLLTWWQEVMEVPCVAIGGITVENARPVVDAGADFLAVASGVWAYPEGPAAAVRGFNRVFEEAKG
ncbi:MAG: thiamine phosphate synthase [Alphaproteobacteria bacterium]|nr:thiamine phosphate synthase [Alphaproteobacteria bacterium]